MKIDFLLLFIACIAISACGLKGPLYLEKTPVIEPEETLTIEQTTDNNIQPDDLISPSGVQATKQESAKPSSEDNNNIKG